MEVLLGAGGGGDITLEGCSETDTAGAHIPAAIYRPTELPEIQVSTCNSGSSFCVSLQSRAELCMKD